MKGKKEIENPSLYKKKLAFNFRDTRTVITDSDKKIFDAFGDLLSSYNDEQKKVIISNNRRVLCIAGAGSGKTTVLTKRIEFIVKYRSVAPEKILAITFTRKARDEMVKRLGRMGHLGSVKVETFNSFCEKMLRQYNDRAYDKPVRVINYVDRITMVKKALVKQDLDMDSAIDVYFSISQKRGKTNEQLLNIFINDCFFIRDYFKFKNKDLDKSDFDAADVKHEVSARMMLKVCNHIDEHMKKYGLRNFADQLMDTIRLFLEHKDIVPVFEHVLIDEYQDVNSTQIKLIDILNHENLFCVGDPRQSVYGWRGSDIRHILKFEDKYPDCEIVTLTKNYRSTKHIVDFINRSIKRMRLMDLESMVEGEKDIKLLNFDSERSEYDFLIDAITSSKLPRNEIFVLARTNRQLNDISKLMKAKGINHVVRSEDSGNGAVSRADDVVLATVHGIKGLEAELVIVTGCTGINFPCKGSEHPVIDMVKVDEYDKEEEERRLFYVALSRAKKSLYLTYAGKRHTHFINDDMLRIIGGGGPVIKKDAATKKAVDGKVSTDGVVSQDVVSRLKEWRREVSGALGVPAFMIMHDRTLNEIALKMPVDVSELREIHGFGPVKITKYGSDILEVVNL